MDRTMRRLLERAEKSFGEPGAFTSKRLDDAWQALRQIHGKRLAAKGEQLNKLWMERYTGPEEEILLEEPKKKPPTRKRKADGKGGLRCYDCRRDGLTADDFHGGQSVCKPCNYARVKAWRKANPERSREQDRRRKGKKRLEKRRQREADKNIHLMKTEVVDG